jgi:hypothetical protein
MAENFPSNKSEKGEEQREDVLGRIQRMIASLLKRERGQDYDITEDTISAKSSIQFVSSTVLLTQTDDDE